MKVIWILSAFMLFGLNACGYSVESLTEDDEARHQILKECADMGAASKDEEKCRFAAKAQIAAAKRSVKSVFE